MPRGTGMGGAPAAQLPEGYQRATAEDIPLLEQAYAQATDVNEKQQIGALLNQLKQQTQAPEIGGGFVTPQQEIKLKAKEAGAVEAAKETTKAEIGREEEGKRITDAFKRAMGEGGVSRVMNLIAGSTSGKIGRAHV